MRKNYKISKRGGEENKSEKKERITRGGKNKKKKLQDEKEKKEGHVGMAWKLVANYSFECFKIILAN